MPGWLRRSLGVIAGVFIGGAILGLIESLGHQVVSGTGLFIIAVIGLGIATATGGMLANWIGQAIWPCWLVGALLLALSLLNVFSFPHPYWFVPAALLCILVGIYVARSVLRTKEA